MALQVPISFTVMEIVPDADNRYFRRKPLRATPGETIAHLRKLSAESFNKSSTDIQLVYYGKLLEDASTFEAAGIRDGSTILVYPKIDAQRISSTPTKPQVRTKILSAIKTLYDMKFFYILRKAEFLRKIHLDMPELDAATFGIIQSASLLAKYLMSKYSHELDEIAEKHPLLGDALMRAIDWAPSLTRVVPPDPPNQYLFEPSVDESENESIEDGTISRDDLALSDPRLVFGSASTNSYTGTTGSNDPPQPGPSGEPQPGPSQAPQRGVTGTMLQAALQAAYSSQAEVATQTFGWQLGIMKDMGFFDERACIEALVKSGGDVDMAVSLLLQE